MTPALSETARMLRDALAPDQVRDGDSERDLHGVDLSFHTPRRPDLVVYPTSTAEVSRVLSIACEHRIPVTPFGAGTSLEGHVIPVRGGISLDLTRLDRILDLSPANLTATVQAGVTRLALQRAAGEHGLFFPVDPGADATLGGMAATNAAGTTTVRYGKMRANVLALEAVLPSGDVIRTGSRAAKSSAGYDLTGLLVGSEGTLAVITEVTVRLHAIPEHVVALRISFPDIESACRTAEPPASVDCQVGMSAPSGRNQLVDGRIDRRVFPADAGTGQKTKEHETPEIPREGRHDGRRQVQHQGKQEPLLPALAVGQVREHDGAEHGPGQIGRRGQSDFRSGEVEGGGERQHRTERGHDRDFETVQNPRDTEGRDDQPVPARPGKTVHALWNTGRNGRINGRHLSSYHSRGQDRA